MEVIDKRWQIRSIRWRWLDENPDDPDGISKKLDELNLDTATENDISDIMENVFWTVVICEECGSFVQKGMAFNTNDGYQTICVKCLREALARLEVHNVDQPDT